MRNSLPFSGYILLPCVTHRMQELSVHSSDYARMRAAALESKKARKETESLETKLPRWLRVKAAAAHLKLGVSTMNKWRLTGGGPPFSRLGTVIVYDVADLDVWANARKVRSTSEPPRAA